MAYDVTAEQLRNVLSYDPETGLMHWRVKPSRKMRVGALAGGANPRGYWKVKVGDAHLMMHRAIWLYMTGEWPSGVVDHIDGNPSNNRWSNLRDVTPRMNTQNQRRAQSRNSCGYLGVTFEKQTRKFKAGINIGDGRGTITLGRFSTADQAHEAYLTAKRQHHSGCAV